MKKIKAKGAVGTEGYLINSMGEYYFRVYNGDFSFKDYKLRHSDLTIRIMDHDAELYETESGELYLDHSRKTLGIK